MSVIYFRRCKKCGNILRFIVKDKIEVYPCRCKTCKKTYTVQETDQY